MWINVSTWPEWQNNSDINGVVTCELTTRGKMEWLDIFRFDKPYCCLWLSKTSVTIKPHNGHYLKSCRKWKFWSFLHTQLGLKWLINSFWNTTIGKSMSRLFCWFNLKILFETHHRRFNFTLQKLAELKNVHTQGEKNHL